MLYFTTKTGPRPAIFYLNFILVSFTFILVLFFVKIVILPLEEDFSPKSSVLVYVECCHSMLLILVVLLSADYCFHHANEYVCDNNSPIVF